MRLLILLIFITACGSRNASGGKPDDVIINVDVTQEQLEEEESGNVWITNCRWCRPLQCYACDFHYSTHSVTKCMD